MSVEPEYRRKQPQGYVLGAAKKQTFVAVVSKGSLSVYETTTPRGEEVLFRCAGELETQKTLRRAKGVPQLQTLAVLARQTGSRSTYLEAWRHDAPARA